MLDAAGVETRVRRRHVVGGLRALLLAAAHPDRVDGVVRARTVGAAADAGTAGRERASTSTTTLDDYEGWAKYNRHYWLLGLPRLPRVLLLARSFREPHSTKQIEDCVAWGLDTIAETLVLTAVGADSGLADVAAVEELLRGISCPVLVVHGTDDRIIPFARSERVAELTGGELVRSRGRVTRRRRAIRSW